jgi:NADH-quinone oxidoreductase subunit E
MLTEQEKKEILEEIKQYPYPAVACIDALKIVQHHRGWVSDESVRDIAETLDMSNEEVDRNVILICDGISCMILGYESLYEYISKKLGITFGETTFDRRFTLLPISCLGDCDHAPAMMINNDHFNKLTVERIDELLDNYK